MLSQVNPNAEDYMKMINLENELGIPPLLRGIPNVAEVE